MKFSIERNRFLKILDEVIIEGSYHLEEDGLYTGDYRLDPLEVARAANCLFLHPDTKYHEWANHAIEKTKFLMCHLTPFFISKVYMEHNKLLTEKSKKAIEDYLLEIREEYIGDEMDVVGVNDNFPFCATYTSMAMAQIFNDEVMLNEAKRRLHQMEMLLKRRGVISEYVSCYTSYQLLMVASLDKIACDEECRNTALNVQNRIWLDYIAHFNSSTGVLCGPYSREYLTTSILAENHFIYTLLKPNVTIYMPKYKWSLHGLSYLTTEFQCDDAIVKLLNERTYPFEFKATAECSASTDSTPESMVRDENCYEYSAGEEKLYTYMTPYYSIGSASKEWHSGVQTSSFTVSYTRCKNPKDIYDVRSIFARYLLNDETVKDQRFFEQGRKTVIGNKNRAIVMYKPKIAAIPAHHNLSGGLAEHYRRQEISGNLGVTSAKLIIMLPLRGIMPDEVLVNNEKITDFNVEYQNPQKIYVKDGDVFFAIHPLEVTDKGRNAGMTIRIRNNQLEIALHNYAGEQHDFSRRDFLHVCNGFGFSIASIEEYNSFEDFVAFENRTVVSDRLITTTHSRQTYVRSVEMTSDDMKLACEVSPASEGIKFMTCDDFPIEIPKLYLTGFDVNTLPYMKKE